MGLEATSIEPGELAWNERVLTCSPENRCHGRFRNRGKLATLSQTDLAYQQFMKVPLIAHVSCLIGELPSCPAHMEPTRGLHVGLGAFSSPTEMSVGTCQRQNKIIPHMGHNQFPGA